MDFLTKMRHLPLRTKKVILWLVVAVLALVLFFFCVQRGLQRLQSFQEDQKSQEIMLEFSNFEQDFQNILNDSEQKIKKIEDLLKKAEAEAEAGREEPN